MNLYSYGNDPVNLIDPWGLAGIEDTEGYKFFAGVGSYFRGIYRTFRFTARFSGLLGKCEKNVLKKKMRF